MTREEMQDAVIKKYGFESLLTIEFCRKCDNKEYPIGTIEKIFSSLMKF